MIGKAILRKGEKSFRQPALRLLCLTVLSPLVGLASKNWICNFVSPANAVKVCTHRR